MKTWKQLQRPRLRGQEEPGARAPLRDRRRRGHARGRATRRWCSAWTSSGRSTCSPIPGRQWAPVAAAAQGDPAATPAAPAAGDLHPPARGPAPARRLRPGHGPALRAHQDRPRTGPSSWSSAATCASLYPPEVRIAIVLRQLQPAPVDQEATSGSATGPRRTTSSSPTRRPTRSWLNRIEAQFTALRYFALDGTDHATHQAQASMIRRYITWRNRHADDQRTSRASSTARKRCLTRRLDSRGNRRLDAGSPVRIPRVTTTQHVVER